jgi:hypothetical protein
MTAPRRLAAILAADVAGYRRLMGEDEAGTGQPHEASLKSDMLVCGYLHDSKARPSSGMRCDDCYSVCGCPPSGPGIADVIASRSGRPADVSSTIGVAWLLGDWRPQRRRRRHGTGESGRCLSNSARRFMPHRPGSCLCCSRSHCMKQRTVMLRIVSAMTPPGGWGVSRLTR